MQVQREAAEIARLCASLSDAEQRKAAAEHLAAVEREQLSARLQVAIGIMLSCIYAGFVPQLICGLCAAHSLS